MEKKLVDTTGRISEGYSKTAVKVSLVSIIGNAALTLFKLCSGIFAHSGAMISDAIHSASDVFSSIIVIIGVKIAAKDSDSEHQYGHERYECVAAIVLAVILCIVGLFIGHTAIEKLTAGAADQLQAPGLLALAAAGVSIVSKEAMYWYTRSYAKRMNSSGLMAEAWHHRSDALSSVGALAGIWGARLGYPWLDAAASLLICAFIVKAAYNIFVDAVEKMVDRSCDDEVLEQLRRCVMSVEGVLGIDRLTARTFGNRLYVDLEICEDGTVSLAEAHRVAEQVHDTIEQRFPVVKHIMIHVNPGEQDAPAPD